MRLFLNLTSESKGHLHAVPLLLSSLGHVGLIQLVIHHALLQPPQKRSKVYSQDMFALREGKKRIP